MPLSEKIASSESLYKKILEEFFSGISDSSFLPSHGIDHHKRVWYYAKEIMKKLEIHGFAFEESLTCKLIIACFLHDSGMAIDTGFKHGPEGRKICERFLKEQNLSITEFTDVLEAIENHDNKEYSVINRPDNLLTILCVADDLDALGFIGIYRYLEIYIKREMPLQDIGDLIIKNSENRFQNFLNTYGFNAGFVEEHTKRYAIVSSFFNSYNQQIPFYKFDYQQLSGYCGVAEIIRERLMNDDSDTSYIYKTSNSPDPVIQWFFTEMNDEISNSKLFS
jgi:HD superfamily phosphodiesterase